MSLEEARKRVSRGASWLDGNEPGWRDVIDVDRLDMDNGFFDKLYGCGCIGAQLDASRRGRTSRSAGREGSYFSWRIEHSLQLGDAYGLGFEVREDGVTLTDLDQAWKEELANGD